MNLFTLYIFKFENCAEAVPKKILELMNVPGLTRENVASHLQVWYLQYGKDARI